MARKSVRLLFGVTYTVTTVLRLVNGKGTKDVSEEAKFSVIKMANANTKGWEISKELRISKSVASKILKKFEDENQTVVKKRGQKGR